jgi:FtsP/CotA-like multicopper oxidase with cupredoxin domain
MGPAFIQIGTEGGFLPAPVVLSNQPISWNLDPTTFDFGVVNGGTLILGPAERADVIVDFSNYAGQTLILYNDAPTAFPALVPQYDYYTGAPDRTDIGGVTSILPGVGPNIRTVMQIKVAGSGGIAPLNDFNPATLSALDNAFRFDSTTGAPGAFALGQDNIVVGQTAYNSAYDTTFPATFPNWGLSRITDTAISFQQVDGTFVDNLAMKPKAIHDEMGATFDDFGRMAAKLGLEVADTNAATANFILQNFVDPPTEFLKPGEVQIWKITHNGVDTHPIHFHLFDVQLLNRVAWDGGFRPTDPNELGWKDTVRINPLQDTIVALRPVLPVVPFPLPNSIRPLNPTTPLGSDMGFSQLDITDGADLVPPLTNQLINFGWEYTWHCHILSHE